jgi:hypothetical protein
MTARLTLVEEQVNVQLESFSIEQSAGKHDLATVTLTNMPSFKIESGAPVWLHHDGAAGIVDFFGYVDTALPYQSGDGKSGGVYFLLSASTALRSGKAATWSNRSPFAIAKDIVTKYGLGLEMDKVGGNIGHFATTTESDWEALVRLATDQGLILTADNTMVRLLDPAKVIRRAEASRLAPLQIAPGTRFIAEESLVPMGYESYEFTGTDKFGVTFKVKVNEDSPVSKLVREEVKSLGDAYAARDRVNRRAASQNRATITTDYRPTIRSGLAVAIRQEDWTRHWFVLNALHTYSTTGRSISTLTLCRQGSRATPGSLPQALKRPGSVLTNGRWRSASSWAREL